MLASTNLAVRFLLELGALGAVGYWGARTGSTTIAKVAVAAGLPLTLAVVWGTFVAPNASVHVPGAAHVLLQVLIFGCAAAALYSIHRAVIGTVFGSAVAINAALMIAMGQ
ncbi:MAG: YrdB family protein [Solirubrobacterales bacterium]|nr:YrdB family protein [Solirubrobacterales bacterium]